MSSASRSTLPAGLRPAATCGPSSSRAGKSPAWRRIGFYVPKSLDKLRQPHPAPIGAQDIVGLRLKIRIGAIQRPKGPSNLGVIAKKSHPVGKPQPLRAGARVGDAGRGHPTGSKLSNEDRRGGRTFLQETPVF